MNNEQMQQLLAGMQQQQQQQQQGGGGINNTGGGAGGNDDMSNNNANVGSLGDINHNNRKFTAMHLPLGLRNSGNTGIDLVESKHTNKLQCLVFTD